MAALFAESALGGQRWLPDARGVIRCLRYPLARPPKRGRSSGRSELRYEVASALVVRGRARCTA
jgi:hypothetical protein